MTRPPKWSPGKERVFRAAMAWYRAYSRNEWAALMPLYNVCEALKRERGRK